MVGPSTEELDSHNELIKFDHEYYKPTSNQQTNSPDVKKNVSILKPSVKAHCQKGSASPVPTEAPVSLSIPVNDLANLNQTLDDILDFDSLVAQDCKPAVPVLTFNSVDSSRKRKAQTDTAAPLVKIEKSEPVFSPLVDSNGLFPGSEHFGLEAALSPVNSTSLESGYLSDSSGPMASPKSDVSGDLGLDNSWEESFSELFPSLV